MILWSNEYRIGGKILTSKMFSWSMQQPRYWDKVRISSFEKTALKVWKEFMALKLSLLSLTLQKSERGSSRCH